MPYQFQPGKMYRMPTHFGPRTGPRQGKDGRKFENKDTPKTTTIAVSFLTNPDQLDVLLPERFELAGEPVDLLVNGKLLAKGEVVVVDENFGVRITDLINPQDRVKML